MKEGDHVMRKIYEGSTRCFSVQRLFEIDTQWDCSIENWLNVLYSYHSFYISFKVEYDYDYSGNNTLTCARGSSLNCFTFPVFTEISFGSC